MHAGCRSSLLHLGGLDGASGTRLGRQHPDEPCAVEVGLGVHEEVGEVVNVAVVVTPPHDGRVGHVLIVLVHQSGSGLRLNGLPQGLVDVVVVAELLNDETGGEAESPPAVLATSLHRPSGLRPSIARPLLGDGY